MQLAHVQPEPEEEPPEYPPLLGGGQGLYELPVAFCNREQIRHNADSCLHLVRLSCVRRSSSNFPLLRISFMNRKDLIGALVRAANHGG